MRMAVLVILLLALVPALPGGLSAQEARIDEGARALRAEAMAAMTSGRNEDAIRYFREFLALYPDRYDETLFLGRCYMAAGMFAEAARFLEGVRARWPGDYQVVEMLGRSYLETGERDRAVEVWHSILTGKEKDVSRYLQVSRAEWDSGLYDEAIATLKEARRFPAHYARFTAEIVRMENTRGNYRGAFLESLPGFEMEERPDLGRASGTIRAFIDAGSPPDLIAAADSFATRGQRNRPFFATLHAALLVEIDDYGGAGGYLLGARTGKVPESDLYGFVLHLYALGSKAGDPAFEEYLEQASSLFVIMFPESPRTPRVLLEGAEHAELAARRGGPREREYAARAVAMADSTMINKRGRPYLEKASLIKARVLLELMRDPDAAIRAVDAGPWRNANTALEAQNIRLEALVLSGRWDEAMKRFEALAASPDSSLAASGRYGRGMVLFYRGEFDEAARALSEVAAEAPWSKWANDALATAVLVRRAGEEDPAVLASFAAAMSADGSGRYGEAADSLAAAAGRFPESALAPEAFYESALLLELAGRRAESVATLERIAEAYPLSRAAPRAVEALAGIHETDDPDEALRWYAVFFERYGEDPWATRVRSRYMRLRTNLPGGAGEADDT